jgi:hypothetical protein
VYGLLPLALATVKKNASMIKVLNGKQREETRVHMNARVSIYEDDWLKNHS